MLSQHRPGRGVAKTSLTIREARSQLLHQALLRCPDLERVEDIADLRFVRGWNPAVLDHAIDDLVSAGLITEACDGRLCVKRRPS